MYTCRLIFCVSLSLSIYLSLSLSLSIYIYIYIHTYMYTYDIYYTRPQVTATISRGTFQTRAPQPG